eukprot:s8377_g3.t1
MSDPEEDRQDDEEELPIKIYTALCIEGAGLKKKTWQPAIQIVSGTNFVKLQKWDRFLTQFVTGKGLRLHSSKEHNINRQWFHIMAELRREACQESLKRVIVQAAESEGNPPPQKIRLAMQQDEYLAGRIVQIKAPAVVDKAGQLRHEEHQLQVLWGIKGLDIWIELTEANMQYIRLAILHSEAYIQPPSTKRAKAAGSPKKRRKRGPKPQAAVANRSDDEDAQSPGEQDPPPING